MMEINEHDKMVTNYIFWPFQKKIPNRILLKEVFVVCIFLHKFQVCFKKDNELLSLDTNQQNADMPECNRGIYSRKNTKHYNE